MAEHLETLGTSLPGGVASQSPQPPDADQILQRCREEFHYLYYTTNDTRILDDFTLCEDCNITNEELEILELSGVCRPYDFSYMPLIYYMYASIFVIALFGNLLVLYTVVTSRKMHTVTNFFIANLAVGDLLIMVFCVPFSVASIIVLQYWPFGEGLCIFVNYCQAISIFVSAYTLVAISVDRYLAIIYPLRPRMTRLQAKVIIGAVWLLALLTTLPIAVFSRLHSLERRSYQYYEREVCMEYWPDEVLKPYYTLALMVLQYFLPLVVLIFTYSRIICQVWGQPGSPHKHQRTMQAPDMASPDTAHGLLRKSTNDPSPAKMIRMTLAVVTVYSLCWLPFNVLITTLDWYEEAQEWVHLHHVWFVFHWLAMSHACYNPLILCWMNTKFREGFLNVFYHLLPCCRERIAECLLKLRQTSGLQRAYTYSTALGSSRTSRNQRYVDDPLQRRGSCCSSTGFVPLQQPTTDVPLRVFRTCSLQTSANGLYRCGARVSTSTSDLQIRASDLQHYHISGRGEAERARARMQYLEVPHLQHQGGQVKAVESKV